VIAPGAIRVPVGCGRFAPFRRGMNSPGGSHIQGRRWSTSLASHPGPTFIFTPPARLQVTPLAYPPSSLSSFVPPSLFPRPLVPARRASLSSRASSFLSPLTVSIVSRLDAAEAEGAVEARRVRLPARRSLPPSLNRGYSRWHFLPRPAGPRQAV